MTLSKLILNIVPWSDIVEESGIDDSEIDWPFSYGDATYTLVERRVVEEALDDYKNHLINRLEAITEDRGNQPGAEDALDEVNDELLCIEKCLVVLNEQAAGVLIAFDG